MEGLYWTFALIGAMKVDPEGGFSFSGNQKQCARDGRIRWPQERRTSDSRWAQETRMPRP